MAFFKQVRQKDPDFCADVVTLRIAEISYKLNLIDEAFEAAVHCERLIKKKDMYAVNILKGKCFDKNRQYKDAIEQYSAALKSCKEQDHNQ